MPWNSSLNPGKPLKRGKPPRRKRPMRRRRKRNPMPSEMHARVMREESVCRLCGEPGRDPDLPFGDEVHHIESAGLSIKDHSRDNLCRLHWSCHRGIDQHGKNEYPRKIGREPLRRGWDFTPSRRIAAAGCEWEGD